MNAERLLQHYETIADAPDAIARLRRFIMDLAVCGTLVPQDPEDEPASKLFERVKREKDEASKSGRSASKTLGKKPQVSGNLPSSWMVATFNDISLRLHYGFTASADPKLTGVRLLRITDIQGGRVEWDGVPGCVIDDDVLPNFLLEAGDILIARTGGTIGKTFLVSEVPVKSVFASYLIRLQPARSLLDRYVKLFCETSTYWEQLTSGSRGAGQPNVNGQTLGEMLIPLPPLAEQHRIVDRVDELMGVCDGLEAAREAREATRDRLTAASLARLQAPDPETFEADTRFALDALPALTTRPDQIKLLRQTILNLAVRGKLVPQDPNDEPASELLKRITAEKARLVKSGEIKAERSEKVRRADAPPFSLPAGWTWTSLKDLCLAITDGDHLPPPKAVEGVPFLVISDVRSKIINYNSERRVPRSYYAALDTIRKPRVGDLLYTLVGSFGIPIPVVSATEFCVQRHIGILRPSAEVGTSFIARFMESSFVFEQADRCATGIAQRTIPLAGLRNFHIPLPPTAEQHRIVAKVDELMRLCDRLEASVTTTAATRRRLLDALLAKALAPVDAHEMEVAE